VDGEKWVGGMMTSSQNPPRSRGGGGAAVGGGVGSLRRPEVYKARKLRKTMSLPEVLLWNQLKARKLGFSFRKQHPIGTYTADFCCPSHMLVIEVDGEVHNFEERALRDEARNAFMIDQGYSILRFSAKDILKDMESVLVCILKALGPLHPPAGGPPPRKRGGFE
jgi:very-short-patch-repair endonuclease